MIFKDFIATVGEAAKQGGSAVCEAGRTTADIGVSAVSTAGDNIKWQPKWVIEKYADDAAYAAGISNLVSEIPGNILLNEGIAELLNLLIGDGSAVPFNNANARIGVGDGGAAEDAGQTDLQGANTFYKAMDAGYPQVSGETVTFRSTFSAAEANFAWNEISVDNGAAAGKNLNRKVQVMGAKAEPATWVVSLQITIS